MLESQLYLGLPGLERVEVSSVYIENEFSKPWGGLWTSTFVPGEGSAWLAYRAREDFTPPRIHGLSLWLLTPDPKARLFHLDTPGDIDRLFSAYSLPLSAPRTSRALGLNWSRLSLDFEAVNLSQSGLEAAAPLFSTWNCESTIWFRDCFLEKQKLAELTWMQAFDLSRAKAINLDATIELP